MKFIEEQLEKLDIYFAPKKEIEKIGAIALLAGFIAYLGYDLLLPYTEGLHKKGERQKKTIQKSITDNNNYLSSISRGKDREFFVKKYTQDIVTKKKKIIHLHDKIAFINVNLDKLSDMLFNKKSWSRFLNSITTKAEVQNVDLQYIDNQYADTNGSFGHVLELTVGCKGDFKNIIRFMNELEQSVLVTDIFKTSFTLDDNSSKIVSDIHISVWGINH